MAGIECEVRFYGAVTVAAGGTDHAKVSLGGSTLGDLLDAIKERWPGVGEYIDGPRSDSAIIVLNEKALEPLNRALKLRGGDILSIMPFVVGG